MRALRKIQKASEANDQEDDCHLEHEISLLILIAFLMFLSFILHFSSFYLLSISILSFILLIWLICYLLYSFYFLCYFLPPLVWIKILRVPSTNLRFSMTKNKTKQITLKTSSRQTKIPKNKTKEEPMRKRRKRQRKRQKKFPQRNLLEAASEGKGRRVEKTPQRIKNPTRAKTLMTWTALWKRLKSSVKKLLPTSPRLQHHNLRENQWTQQRNCFLFLR